MFVCICHAVSDREILEHIQLGAHTEDEIGRRCGAGTGCGSCQDRISDHIDETTLAGAPAA